TTVRAHFDHAGKSDPVIARPILGLEHIAQSQASDLHFGGLRRAGMGIVSLERTLFVAALGGAVRRDLDRSRLAHGEHQINDRVARGFRQVKWYRLISLPRQRKRGAVFEYATGAG